LRIGSKQVVYAEEALVTWAARKLERPVKWVADRSEAFLSDAQGRDHVTHAELALDRDGKFLGLRVSTLANIGAYVSTFGPNIPTNLYGPLLAGVYTTPAIYCEVKVVFTNTVPTDAYRGAGRPEATFVLERLVDVAARDLGIDRVEIRRRNFIPLDSFPYQTPVMLQYDSGDHDATLAKALEVSRWSSFPTRREETTKRGKLRVSASSRTLRPAVWHPPASRASLAPAAASSKAPNSAASREAVPPLCKILFRICFISSISSHSFL
jgi:carbon-monoxide dehydrogenase large subunit